MKDLKTMLDASPYTNKGTNIVQLPNFGGRCSHGTGR